MYQVNKDKFDNIFTSKGIGNEMYYADRTYYTILGIDNPDNIIVKHVIFSELEKERSHSMNTEK